MAPPAPSSHERVATLALARPHWSDTKIRTVMAESDAVIEESGAAEPSDLRALVGKRLADTTCTEAELRAFYDNNPALFGRRPFSAVRENIRSLVTIDKVRQELGVVREGRARYASPATPP